MVVGEIADLVGEEVSVVVGGAVLTCTIQTVTETCVCGKAEWKEQKNGKTCYKKIEYCFPMEKIDYFYKETD